MRRIQTRSFEECEDLVRRWLAGQHLEVIEELGAEPSADFLRSFKPVDPASVVSTVVVPTKTKRKSVTRVQQD